MCINFFFAKCKCWLSLCHHWLLAVLDWLFGQFSSSSPSLSSSTSSFFFFSYVFSITLHPFGPPSFFPSFFPSFLPSFLLYNGLTMTPIRKGAVMTAMAVMVGKLRLGVQLQLRPSPQRWYLCDCQTSAVWGSDIWSTTYDIWYWISSATAVWHMCSRQCSIPVFSPTKNFYLSVILNTSLSQIQWAIRSSMPAPSVWGVGLVQSPPAFCPSRRTDSISSSFAIRTQEGQNFYLQKIKTSIKKGHSGLLVIQVGHITVLTKWPKWHDRGKFNPSRFNCCDIGPPNITDPENTK